LHEDKARIKQIISTYLGKTPVLDWKYQEALNLLLQEKLEIDNRGEQLETLGELYKEEVTRIYQARTVDYSTQMKRK
jgi:hypothetical protein